MNLFRSQVEVNMVRIEIKGEFDSIKGKFIFRHAYRISLNPSDSNVAKVPFSDGDDFVGVYRETKHDFQHSFGHSSSIKLRPPNPHP